MRTILAGLCVLLFAGCMQPYHEEVLVDINTNETPFLIELEGDNEQATLKSEDYLRKKLVQSKRIMIPYRWKQTGRQYIGWNGLWIPSARLILVDRQPETREWVSNSNQGTSKRDQGIWVESSDSVGFSTGISITARIDDHENAVKFLYNYPPKRKKDIKDNSGWDTVVYQVDVTSLEEIMDREVRTKVQEIFADKAAEYTMDNLRDKKQEIMVTLRQEVVPFFADRGITITTIGMFGGFTYENPKIQEAIDEVFRQQQDEEVAKAEAKAAEQRKEALRLIGEGKAQQAIEVARGEAEGIKLVADAKAYEIEQLQKDPETYLKLKAIEVEMRRLEKWDGRYPNYLLQSGGEGHNMLLNLPQPGVK